MDIGWIDRFAQLACQRPRRSDVGNVGGLIYPWLWIHFYGVFVGNIASNEVIKDSWYWFYQASGLSSRKDSRFQMQFLQAATWLTPCSAFFWSGTCKQCSRCLQTCAGQIVILSGYPNSKLQQVWLRDVQMVQQCGKTINFPKTHAKASSKLLYIKVVEKLPKLLQVLQAVAVVGPFFLEHGKNNPKYPWRADKASRLKFPHNLGQLPHIMADYMDLDPKRINTLTDVFQSTATHPCKTGLLQHSTLTKWSWLWHSCELLLSSSPADLEDDGSRCLLDWQSAWNECLRFKKERDTQITTKRSVLSEIIPLTIRIWLRLNLELLRTLFYATSHLHVSTLEPEQGSIWLPTLMLENKGTQKKSGWYNIEWGNNSWHLPIYYANQKKK